jgi:hypothetical protein
MVRDHVEFIQVQRVPWRRGRPGGARADVDVRVLSADPVSGACSLLVRYPPGWRQDGPQRLAGAEEFFVLDGELAIDGRAYGLHCYAYLPAGYLRREAGSAGGAVVLTFFSALPTLDASLADPDPRASGLVERLDAFAMSWERRADTPELRPGRSRKSLRTDPVTGEETWLATGPPHGVPPGGAGPQETHPVVEEMFMISGDLHGNCGVMRPGAYFWRPPGILHGPYGTRLGTLLLFRTQGGPLVSDWQQERVPFRYDTPYRPFLPDGLELLPAPDPASLEVRCW